MSAATPLEASIVLDSRTSPQQRRRLDDLLVALEVDIVPFDGMQWALAREAYRDFGRGSGHAARLNMGDCYAYACTSRVATPCCMSATTLRRRACLAPRRPVVRLAAPPAPRRRHDKRALRTLL